jgi:hypothetical protein
MKVCSERWALRYLLGGAFFVVTAFFLLKLAYLSVWVATAIGVWLSLAFHCYVRQMFGVRGSVVWLLPMLGAVEVDALGNYFHLYGKPFGPMQYDEFSHMLCSALLTPAAVWAVKAGFERGGHRLPLGLIAPIAASALYSICGFYEVIELWDERYFRGRRIWGPYDTSNDLQWDLIGVAAGALLAYAMAKASQVRRVAAASTDGASLELRLLRQ